MTAVIAYAEPNYAFVAADSKRILGFFPTVKVHTWGPKVVFAQSGNAVHLSQCICAMAAFRGSVWDTDFRGICAAFSSNQPVHQANALAAQSKNSSVSIDGTLVVADADSGILTQFDFRTGVRTPVGSPTASGDPATTPSMMAAWGSSGRKDLAMWAYDSINPLCGTIPSIDKPIDLLISRPDTYGQIVVGQRLSTAPSVPLPFFDIP